MVATTCPLFEKVEKSFNPIHSICYIFFKKKFCLVFCIGVDKIGMFYCLKHFFQLKHYKELDCFNFKKNLLGVF